MIKFVLTDKQKLIEIINVIYTQISYEHISPEKMIEMVLEFDYINPDHVAIWDFLDQNLPPEHYNSLDYTFVNELFEMIVEMVQVTLNDKFNMHHSTLYTFNKWADDAVCLNVFTEDYINDRER
jgi:hypothetical protein